METKTLYEILGIEQKANTNEITSAYRKKERMHPTKGGNTDEFKKIQAAFDILSDLELRRIYDSSYLDKLSTDESIDKLLKYKQQKKIAVGITIAGSGSSGERSRSGGSGERTGSGEKKTVKRSGSGSSKPDSGERSDEKGTRPVAKTYPNTDASSVTATVNGSSNDTRTGPGSVASSVASAVASASSSPGSSPGSVTSSVNSSVTVPVPVSVTSSTDNSSNNSSTDNSSVTVTGTGNGSVTSNGTGNVPKFNNNIGNFVDKNGRIIKINDTVRHIKKNICPGINTGIVASFNILDRLVEIKCKNTLNPGHFTLPDEGFDPLDLQVVSDEANNEVDEETILTPPTILGALPSEINIKRVSIEEYKARLDKNIPLIIESAPNTILVFNGLACELLIDNLGKLGDEEVEWRNLIFIAPSESFSSHEDVISEQICFLILFAEIFFTTITGNIDAEHTLTQGSSFIEKYDNVMSLLNNPVLEPDIKTRLESLWNRIQEKYIKQTHRYVTFVEIKSIIISGPDYVIPYFEESFNMMSNKDLKRKFKQQQPWGSVSVPGGLPVSNNNN
jgi:curved DNA-binding protein CbpA